MASKVSSHFCFFLFKDPCWILVGHGKDTAVVLYYLFSWFVSLLDLGQRWRERHSKWFSSCKFWILRMLLSNFLLTNIRNWIFTYQKRLNLTSFCRMHVPSFTTILSNLLKKNNEYHERHCPKNMWVSWIFMNGWWEKRRSRSVFFQHIKNCQNLLPRVNPIRENMMNVQTKEDWYSYIAIRYNMIQYDTIQCNI